MNDIRWRYDVFYNPDTQRVVFEHNPNNGNSAESLLDYYTEEYPEKSWLELVTLVLPEIKNIRHPELLKFYEV